MLRHPGAEFITLRTPRGNTSAINRPATSVVSGVNGEGFSTTELPASRAGPIFIPISRIG
jgi:hypothetical protein